MFLLMQLRETYGRKYVAAFREPRRLQLELLEAGDFIKAELTDDYGVSAILRRIRLEHKELELRRPFDKAHDDLQTLPTLDVLEQLYNQWMAAAQKNRIEGHVGLMNL